MEDIEELLLAGDIETVNEVLSRTGTISGPPQDALAATFEAIAIPEDVYPKVSIVSTSIRFS